MARIGIIGGTFDPVHEGHLNLALDAMEQAALDAVWFMPAKIQPFKQDRKVTGPAQRLEMLALAVEGHPGLLVSTLEMELEGVSYTYRTLREVRRRLLTERMEAAAESPGGGAGVPAGEETEPDTVYFITGTDTFIKMDTWMHAEELLTENAVIVGSRPGYQDAEIERCRHAFKELYGTEVLVIRNDLLDISSTAIKEKLAAGESITGLVPQAVEDYIYGHDLYR
ncbi:MAG: nicotinate (nicotinamide) nucleotide adenylyltransferase [Clostridiales bacterium]|nr:nicotinate (nicotinamide) nucleotide adenylyltransferase [Clostridiales bacterium]